MVQKTRRRKHKCSEPVALAEPRIDYEKIAERVKRAYLVYLKRENLEGLAKSPDASAMLRHTFWCGAASMYIDVTDACMAGMLDDLMASMGSELAAYCDEIQGSGLGGRRDD